MAGSAQGHSQDFSPLLNGFQELIGIGNVEDLISGSASTCESRGV